MRIVRDFYLGIRAIPTNAGGDLRREAAFAGAERPGSSGAPGHYSSRASPRYGPPRRGRGGPFSGGPRVLSPRRAPFNSPLFFPEPRRRPRVNTSNDCISLAHRTCPIGRRSRAPGGASAKRPIESRRGSPARSPRSRCADRRPRGDWPPAGSGLNPGAGALASPPDRPDSTSGLSAKLNLH